MDTSQTEEVICADEEEHGLLDIMQLSSFGSLGSHESGLLDWMGRTGLS